MEKTRFITTEIIEQIRHWEISFMVHLIGGSQNHEVTPLLEQNPDFTIMGICLGMQIMNIAAGGSLYQDIPAQIYGVEFCEEIATLPPISNTKTISMALTTMTKRPPT